MIQNKHFGDSLEAVPAERKDSAQLKVSDLSMLGELSIHPYELATSYPPHYSNRYKENMWREAINAHERKLKELDTEIVCSRFAYGERDFGSGTVTLDDMTGRVEEVDRFFDYQKSDAQVTRWYLNFADPSLFYAYGSSLFAQDEIQTLEHPLLGSLRECMIIRRIEGLEPRTSVRGKPTPCLVQNVPYQIKVSTSPTLPDGTRVSIYGNRFSAFEYSNPQVLDTAIRIKADIGLTNIIAMAAPTPQSGLYTAGTIAEMLETAYVAFGAAVNLSKTPATEIHTGRWGAGAFGGNEELAIAAQIIAASATGTDKIVFHAVTARCLERARQTVADMTVRLGRTTTFDSVIGLLHERAYRWGVSDGN